MAPCPRASPVLSLCTLLLLGACRPSLGRPLVDQIPFPRLQRFMRHIMPMQETLGFSRYSERSDIDSEGEGLPGVGLAKPLEQGYKWDSDFVSVVENPSPTTTVVAAAAPAPGPSPSSCPPVPGECDFYFEGFRDSLPTFNPFTSAPDTPISPAILTSVQKPSVSVIAINTGEAEYTCSDTAPPPDSQFYITGVKLQARTFNGNGTYLNQYVKLRFTSVEFSAYGMTMNLNQGQGDAQFPEDRRCVVFQTSGV